MTTKRQLNQVIEVLSQYKNWLTYCDRDHNENKEYTAVLKSLATINQVIDEHVDDITKGDIVRCIVAVVTIVTIGFICFGGLDYVIK
jgi:hypothetical protein